MKKVLCSMLALSLLAAGTVASAGAKWDDTVYINQEWREAYASLGSARNSSDSVQYFQIINDGYGEGSGVWFMASDAAGTFAYCYTSAPSIVETARAATSDSFVRVYWDESNTCTSLEVRTGSMTPPKTL